MIKIAFFEDHPIVTNSLIHLFEKENAISLEFSATTKDNLFEKIKDNSDIDILIIDVIATEVNGLEIFEFVNTNYPKIKTIAFTTLNSPILVENLLLTGVKGYVNKNQEIEDLLEAIKIVNDELVYLTEDYQFLAKRNYNSETKILTNREIEILQLIIKEFTSTDISEKLNISVYTVENHRKNIFTKLNVKNVAGMVREASKLGYFN